MEEAAPTRDVEYLQGLREAVSSGVKHGIELLETGTGAAPPFPMALITQARLAARQKISLEVVIRRYLAGKAVFETFVFDESMAIGKQGPKLLRGVLIAQEAELDRLLAKITEEYRQEERDRSASRDPQLTARVRRLLAGEPLDLSLLEYGFESHHVGLVASSAEARQIIRKLASSTDSRALIVCHDETELWAWLGRKDPFDPQVLGRLAASLSSPSAPLGMGEPNQALTGWRLTHRQARAAFSIAQASPEGFARYADVSLLASAAQDHVVTASLHQLYLSPLAKGRDGGQALRETLRAYFAANGNGSSAASALKVTRQTVANRLEQVEERLGQPLAACAASVHTALQLEELGLLDRGLDIV